MIKRRILHLINKNEFLRKKMLYFSVNLHNFSYNLIKKFLIKPGELHPKHKIMNYHNFFVKNTKNSDIILDIGCGNGALASSIAKRAKKIIGIDIQEEKILQAKKEFNNKNCKFIIGDATKFDFSIFNIKKFDKIILSNVLEHIEKRNIFLSNLHKLSDTILLRVPMEDRDWLTVYKKENGYKYMLDPTHFVEYTLNSLNKELTNSDWKITNYSVQFGEFWGIIKNI